MWLYTSPPSRLGARCSRGAYFADNRAEEEEEEEEEEGGRQKNALKCLECINMVPPLIALIREGGYGAFEGACKDLRRATRVAWHLRR